MEQILRMHQLPGLSKFEGVIHGFSDRSYGNQAFSVLGIKQSPEQVKKNRIMFLNELGFSLENGVAMYSEIPCAKQEVVIAEESFRGKGMTLLENAVKTEALITNIKGLFLFLLTADCHPIIFYDPITHSIGLAHGSRQMTGEKLVIDVVEKMKQSFGTKQENLYVGIGPGIKKESYQLEYLDQMFHEKQFSKFVEKQSNGTFSLDLPSINKELLAQYEVKEENIEISDIDTARSPNYFSHYRDSRDGTKEERFATAVMLK